jgi:hypothetical protein
MAEEVKIEEVFAIGDAKESFEKAEVGGRTDGEKLGRSLDDPEEKGLKKGHRGLL